jgi:hypothetical protein
MTVSATKADNIAAAESRPRLSNLRASVTG